jgi:ferredoxin-NAD(P)+ reductase (naphthalene dioxygenase ferredoxin-specific)
MELVVQPNQRRISFQSGQNLLDVLRDNAVPVSYSCLSGRCGTCRCKIVEGQVVDAGPQAGRPQLSDNPYVLACQSVLTENCTVEIPDVDEVIVHPARIVKATVVAIDAPTHDIRRLRVKLAKPLTFSPGQYASVQFTPEHIRPYSMAGLPDDEEMEFQIRRVPGGRVTDYVFEQLKPQDSIRLSGPLGTAYLRSKHTGPMLCVGGGTGIAPVLSIARGAIAASMHNPIHLYFGVRSMADLYDADRLHALAAAHPQVKVNIVVATGKAAPGLRGGLLTDAIKADWPSLAGWRAYLCGAPVMVEAVNMLVTQLDMAATHIHADAFYPSGV